ncbi:MAG: hypothetical protein HC852_01520 [Acaryochloridaceae cyanobacterium RU_4_10]|nr:hypothetical protein [Acaryochloridaceae cyanobacterium RU_4_10]
MEIDELVGLEMCCKNFGLLWRWSVLRQWESSEEGWVCSKRDRNASPHTHDFGYSLGRVKEVEHMETWKLWFIVFCPLSDFGHLQLGWREQR